MEVQSHPYLWKRMPFFRLIIPLIVGIICQWYLSFSSLSIVVFAVVASLLLAGYFFLSFKKKYTYRWLQGIGFNILFFVVGAFLVFSHDIRNQPDWIGKYSSDTATVWVTIQEQLVEKAKSYKAEASIEYIRNNGEWKKAKGKILVYFSKDSIKPNLGYGSQLLFIKPLQAIKNAGNPGGFDYQQYSAFQDVYHQVFLKANDYIILPTTKKSRFTNWLLQVRFSVINTLRKYITKEDEAGVAEALLIGYRDDLDKELVQAYSNTGVVHIIAISGLHLGMIYAALVFLLKPFRRTKWIKWCKPIIILGVLWIFTLLAGGVPSILRSAVMFTFIVMGETLDRKSSIYNTLASSAFVMLCINPFFLWDIGFQLSYAAVFSIVVFSRSVYNWFYIHNKVLDFFWKLSSVTLSAQILTLPIIFFSFHQFPNYFLITNCFIVPLSSIILFAELLLLMCSYLPVAAKFVGMITTWLLSCMNGFIMYVNSLPYAVYDGIQITLSQTILLYIFLIAGCAYLMNRYQSAIFISLISLMFFAIEESYHIVETRKQEKVVVYNIPKYQAIDFISGNNFSFVGDTLLWQDGYLRNFHLKPSRTFYKIGENQRLQGLYISHPFIYFKGKRILLYDKPYKFSCTNKINLDLIVVSHNPKLKIADLANTFTCKQYVIDGSNSMWKTKQWKKDCDSLHLRLHSTADKGAFELNVQ